MPKKHKNRTMKGGFWNSLTQGFSDAWEKTKKATSDAYSSATGSSTPTPAAAPMPTQPDTPMPTQPASPTSSGYMGGRTRRRRMRGGFKDNTPTTGLAAHAASFSGETAQPHNWVGGRTRRRNGRKHRCNKSCRHRR